MDKFLKAENMFPAQKRVKITKFYVGLVVVTSFSMNGKPPVATLRRRGEYSNLGKKESWPGSYTLTVHASCVRGKDHDEILEKALLDQLGLASIISHMKPEKLVRMKRNDAATGEPHIVTNYKVRLPFNFLKNARASAFEGGFRFLGEEEVPAIKNVEDYPRGESIPDGVIAMFPDEIAALRKALTT